MLDFVARLKDNSTNFTINGIDRLIIRSTRYEKALAREIVRATRINGLIFGCATILFDENEGALNLYKLKKYNHRLPINTVILEKMKA